MQRAAPELSCVPLAERAFVRTSDTLVSLSLSLSDPLSLCPSLSRSRFISHSLVLRVCVCVCAHACGWSNSACGFALFAWVAASSRDWKGKTEIQSTQRGLPNVLFSSLFVFFSFFYFLFSSSSRFSLAGNILRAV